MGEHPADHSAQRSRASIARRRAPAISCATVALVSACLFRALGYADPISAGTGGAAGSHVLYQDIFVPVGLAHGQMLRYTWANLNDLDPRHPGLDPSRVQVRLLLADGTEVARAEAAAVGPGEFQSFEFRRDDISWPGDAPSGRLQTRFEVTFIGQTAPPQGIRAAFADGLEVIDLASGRTTVALGGGVNRLTLDDTRGREPLSPGSPDTSVAGEYLIAVGPGETLRVSALNPPAPSASDGRKYKMLVAPVILLADGQVAVQGDEVALDPGEFHSFDVHRADLPVSGADRVPVRVEIQQRVFRGFVARISQGQHARAPTVVELVDDSLGLTTLLISDKPKEIVVVGAK